MMRRDYTLSAPEVEDTTHSTQQRITTTPNILIPVVCWLPQLLMLLLIIVGGHLILSTAKSRT